MFLPRERIHGFLPESNLLPVQSFEAAMSVSVPIVHTVQQLMQQFIGQIHRYGEDKDVISPVSCLFIILNICVEVLQSLSGRFNGLSLCSILTKLVFHLVQNAFYVDKQRHFELVQCLP